MTVRIEPIEDVSAFLEDWRRLYANTEAPSFYLSPAWIEAWLAGKPADAVVFSVSIGQAESPVLLGAVGLSPRRSPPIIGPREARCLEFGDNALDAIYIEFNDFLVARAADGAALRSEAATALFSTLRPADAFVFRNARRGLCDAVGTAAERAGMRARIVAETPTFQCDLAAMRKAGKHFLDSLNGSAKEQIVRSMRLYKERGALRFEIANTAAERRDVYARIKALHVLTWKRRGKPGVYANPDFSAFHDRLMEAAPETVSLCLIYAGEEIIGGLHNFIHGGRVLNYQSGFCYEDDNRLKPGLVSHALAAQHYLDAEYAVYDLLAGEARYKRALGSEGERLSTVAVERSGFRSALRRMKALARRF